MIEGIVGSSYRSDISIDDYSFKDRECEPLGNCDFEQDTCKWLYEKLNKNKFKKNNIKLGAWKNAESGADFEWIRQRSETSTAGTGPSVDHTLGTSFGAYLFIETSYPIMDGDNGN